MKSFLITLLSLFTTFAIAGYDGTNKLITANELLQQKDNYVILDVRSEDEFNQGHIDGAINIPHYAVLDELDQLKSFDKPIVVHCRSGKRAWKAEKMLMQNGVTNLIHLQGDMLNWVENKHPLTVTN
ncbi:MAG: rhodanese-related sulfurtransferase [Psychrosphaera sp.]|jgi:rhodanese-related sulfurtransferase|uniref:Rhodanese-like domain-containing protein n=1 Tax=Psychrosphaera aquimarina TaxID=2044854 RepID=A0ABU3R0R7_9GAMM|nr:rhodanese-like domain-containing protein [Psychrosphaera aquimarina]MDU0113129.1 rhodanese-like domain-containing protein [Psychrosphaera aquimarina]